MEHLPLKYLGYTVVFQEVPDEISLAINISGCPYKCRGCHSQYLWEYEGNFVSEDLDILLDKYKGYITCVCFMGGDQNIEELRTLLERVKNAGLTTCLYTGCEKLYDLKQILDVCDYVKCGKYDERLLVDNNIQYGVKLASSNQRMYKRGLDY
jgi:anaerobic ribonucleoside-triphosphate reductase activating protein